MTFEEYKNQIDSGLGLESISYDDIEGHIYLEYVSPTGVVLFTLYVEQREGVWKSVLIGDSISNFLKKQLRKQ